ncbi:hypothetical protein PS9374_01128 [Planomonospora sphaerica]|uniref:Uncharacterized protein n=1 Tax=Planomonospora sphaerica TaxID=161355 RepID=A0A171BSB5_9ACTN|nr:hypothetical protein PS9374_01128 [Planomonospora sphaerica]
MTVGIPLVCEGEEVNLSKAFLLAADTAITDPSITRQLSG